MSDELRADLEFEIADLDLQVEHLVAALAKATDAPEHSSHLGFLMHGFYTGLEKCFRFVVQLEGQEVPTTKSSHSDLLGMFAEPLGPHFGDVKELLGFRHRFRHTYAPRLNFALVHDLAQRVPALWRAVRPMLMAHTTHGDSA